MNRTPTSSSHTETLVRELVASSIGSQVQGLEQMTYGHGSVTYRVDTEAISVIVRTNASAKVYDGTLANIEVLRKLGLPVPNVLKADVTMERMPFAYIITDLFPGRDVRYEIESMTHAQTTKLAEQIVGFERLVMTLPEGSGYGFIPIDGAGPHPSWSRVVRSDREKVETDDLLLQELTRKTYSAFDNCEQRLEAIRPTCFLDDLTTKNVIVERGTLQGVIDFDVVCYGDPMYWLALAQVGIWSDVGPPGQFYIDELIRLYGPTDTERANFALYCALHAVAFISWGNTDKEWRERMFNQARLWIASSR